MRDPTAEKFRMTWLKLYFYKARGGCCKTICEVAWANAISVKFKGVSIKLTECGLDYILILIKFKGFFIKLPCLVDNPSHPCVIRRPRNSRWRGSNCISIKLERVAVKLFVRWLKQMLFLQSSRGFYKINWLCAGLFINFDKVWGFFYKIAEPPK